MPSKKKYSKTVKQRDPILTPEEKEEFTKYEYPFENMAFEGGGSKGTAYAGTIRVLEEIGAWSNLKRFAGASAGAIVAMWAALGLDSHEIQQLNAVDQQKICYDARFGKVSALPNLAKNLGMNPGKRLLKWLGEPVAERLGNPDATFMDLYQKTGKELCVVTVNTCQLDVEYCHVKTTPNMPIRLAVRMSSAIPGVLAPVKYALHGAKELFCDGGLVCNYPVHVYDGWYLSMKPEDNFLKRMPNLNNASSFLENSKFGTEPNRKTFGALLYSETEQEVFKNELIERVETYIPNPTPIPDTPLAKERIKLQETRAKAADKHKKISDALSAFMLLMQENDVDNSGTITKDELIKALDGAGPKFTNEQRELLFEGKTVDELYAHIDEDGNGEITVPELVNFAEAHGVQLRKAFQGYDSRTIKSLGEYFDAIIETLLLNMKKINMKSVDLHRTMGIDTSYLDTLDFGMLDADKNFLVQQGKVACIAFLREHIARIPPPERKERPEDEQTDAAANSKKTKHGFGKFFSVKRRRSGRKKVETESAVKSATESTDKSPTDSTDKSATEISAT